MKPDTRLRPERKRVRLATFGIRTCLSTAARSQIFVRATVINRDNVPSSGPVLVCPNHPSTADSVLTFGALRRVVVFLATAGLFNVPALGRLLRWMGHIPVARGTDAARDALVFARQALDADCVVIIFPEGGCNQGDTLREPKGGVAELAFATGAPVVPVGLIGTRKVKPRHGWPRLMRQVTIHFGEPMRAPYISGDAPLADRIAFTARLMTEISHLSGQKLPPSLA